MMKIALVTPAQPGSRTGNRATAERWSRLLQKAGHQVLLLTEYTNESCDLFIALHAWRSHEVVTRFRTLHPKTPMIVVLTGTDIYDHQYRYPEQTYSAMDSADCLVGLHHQVHQDIPERYAGRLATVLQSADKPASGIENRQERFDICVIGHLRQEKDPLRAALAARLLSDGSAIRVLNAGKPYTSDWEQLAISEQEANPRFKWLGELDKPAIHRLMRSSRAMVISSLMEGGANVVSEACRAGLPVIASDIPGNIGLLGDDYPGYFNVGDEVDLAKVLQRAEQSPEFLSELSSRVIELASCFTPEAERAALLAAMDSAVTQRDRFNREA